MAGRARVRRILVNSLAGMESRVIHLWLLQMSLMPFCFQKGKIMMMIMIIHG